jgi:hypothetical protein
MTGGIRHQTSDIGRLKSDSCLSREKQRSALETGESAAIKMVGGLIQNEYLSDHQMKKKSSKKAKSKAAYIKVRDLKANKNPRGGYKPFTK